MQNSPLNTNYQQMNIQPVAPQPCVTNPQVTQIPVNCQNACNMTEGAVPNGANLQVPNYSGVNIQIFNPSVMGPGANPPSYNVNAPNYSTQTCYPQDYYTQKWGGNGTNPGLGTAESGRESNIKDNEKSTITSTNNTETHSGDKKVTKEIVQLTDDYIKSIENYLNSQDSEIRLMGAKEVAARLQEDKTRRDDKALTALINKMLQDPSQPVRFLALSMLDNRFCTGNDYTVKLLQGIQQTSSGYGQDALQASQILLKMTGQTVKKEFNPEDLYPEPKKKGK